MYEFRHLYFCMYEDNLNSYKVSTLSNGIKIASEKINHVNSFSLGFWFNVGSRDENKKTNGISHFLEHMFFKGTSNRSARQISEEVESLGGYLNAFTSKEHTCFYGRGMSKNIEQIFSVLADMVQNSVFDETEIYKESKVVVDELHDIEDSPEELIFDKFETNILKGNSLGMPIIGTESNVLNFSRNDLIGYIEQKYAANKFFVVASGAVDHELLENLAEKYLTKIVPKRIRKRKSFSKSEVSSNYFFKDINQAHLIIGGTTYGYNRKERAISNVISNILGEGSSSRLFLSVREKNGIGYQVNTFMNSFYDISSFGVYVSTNEDSIKKAEKLIKIEFDKIKNKKVTNKELQKAKEYIKSHVQMSLESTSNRMMRIGSSLLYYDRIKTLEESMNEIDSVTKEDVLSHSQLLLDESNITSTLIASKNRLF